MRVEPVNPPSFLPNTAYAVLGLLSFGQELSGYEIRQWALTSLRHFYWSPAQSQIYRELRRLEELGYVEPREVVQTDRPDKMAYSITASGLAELTRWVEQSEPERPVIKHPALLRVFFGHVTTPDRVADIVEKHADQVEDTLAEIEGLLVGLRGSAASDNTRWALEWAAQIHRGDLFGSQRSLSS